MSIIAAWLALLLARAFGIATFVHMSQQHRSRDVLSLLGVGNLLPLILAADAGVLVLLLVDSPIGAAAALTYLLVASLWITRRAWGTTDCGCSVQPEPVDHRFLLRNFALGLGALVVLATPAVRLTTFEGVIATGLFTLLLAVEYAIQRLSTSKRALGAVRH